MPNKGRVLHTLLLDEFIDLSINQLIKLRLSEGMLFVSQGCNSQFTECKWSGHTVSGFLVLS